MKEKPSPSGVPWRRLVAGAAPSDVPLKLTIDRMRQQLTHAIETEEYEKAAGLRDQIRALSAQLEANTAAREG